MKHGFSLPCLSLDLEVGRKDGRIHAFAAVRSDSKRRLVFSGGDLAKALAKDVVIPELVFEPEVPASRGA